VNALASLSEGALRKRVGDLEAQLSALVELAATVPPPREVEELQLLRQELQRREALRAPRTRK
jgi:hypothetical protein